MKRYKRHIENRFFSDKRSYTPYLTNKIVRNFYLSTLKVMADGSSEYSFLGPEELPGYSGSMNRTTRHLNLKVSSLNKKSKKINKEGF